MKDRQEQLEETISLLKEDVSRYKKSILKYKLQIENLNTYIKDQHDKYVASLELGRARVNESNNKIHNFDQLFQKLSRDIRYLNETSNLVSFSEESKEVMNTKMHVIDVYSPIDNDDDNADEFEYDDE